MPPSSALEKLSSSPEPSASAPGSLRESFEQNVGKPFEPRRQDGDGGLRRELLDELLVELSSLRGERNHPRRAVVAVRGPKRGVDDVDAEHHAGAAAVGIVVHLPRAERRRIAVVEEAQLELGAEHGRERLLLGEPAEGVRDLGEDVDAHGGPGYP